jgi:hypothetical protein
LVKKSIFEKGGIRIRKIGHKRIVNSSKCAFRKEGATTTSWLKKYMLANFSQQEVLSLP